MHRRSSRPRGGRPIRFLPVKSVEQQDFVQACAGDLAADLFILDEFKRFKELLGEEKKVWTVSSLARCLKTQARVILLSATHFKALTHLAEDEEQNAYVNQLRFLLHFLAKENAEKLLGLCQVAESVA